MNQPPRRSTSACAGTTRTPRYNDYVTPADVVSALQGWTNVTIPKVGFNVDDFISTGSNREGFKGALQPRVGFSYDLIGNQRAVIFGGYGRAYDRNLFDYLQLERTKSTFPTVNFNFAGDPNHPCSGATCVPYPRYLTTGPREDRATGNGGAADRPHQQRHQDAVLRPVLARRAQASWGWNLDGVLVHREQERLRVAARQPPRRTARSSPPGTTWGSPFGSPIPGFGALVLGVFGLDHAHQRLYLRADKPYRVSTGGA